MRVSQRLIAATVLAALSCALAGCGTNGSFDPTDMLDFLDTKKKLPGDRKPVFPDGVPGVEQGVPKELYKGAQQQPQDVPPPVASLEPEPKPKKGAAKSAPRVRPSVAPSADQPAPEAQQDATPEPDTKTAAPFPEPIPPAKRPKRRSTTVPESDAEPAPQAQTKPAVTAASSQQQSANPFPAPISSGGFQR
ncbi:MAG: hypothetical protein NTZ72_05025 [Afipia sp.]|jgi:hypothetical protein|nr:hypothetical protein [Afipia sp.]